LCVAIFVVHVCGGRRLCGRCVDVCHCACFFVFCICFPPPFFSPTIFFITIENVLRTIE